MKKFILSILSIAVFFVGLGAIVEKAGARFKSDEKALELVRRARIAIGGDPAINSIQSLRIVGQTTRIFTTDNGSKTETGETEIALQLPDKLMKMTKIGHRDELAETGAQLKKQFDVVVVGNGQGEKHVIATPDGAPAEGNAVHRIIIKRPDGTTQELTGADAEKFRVENGEPGKAIFKIEDMDGAEGGQKVMIRRVDGAGGISAHHDGMRQNEMLRLTLGLLMSAPQGMDVDYQLGGEGDVDGTSCNIVVASLGGSSFKIYLSKSTDLPVMMSYTGVKLPGVIKIRTGGAPVDEAGTNEKVIIQHADGMKDFAPAEFNVKFSDFRTVNGVQLPYKWIQTVAGNADETFDVTSYEVNPANIADKFKGGNVMFKVKKPADQ